MDQSCPCCSGEPYDTCCKPFHRGRYPDTALQLMRSRYSAYALDLPDYIITTTHPANNLFEENTTEWRESISQFSRNSTFEKLEILDVKEKDTVASVTFTAFIMQRDKDITFTERSYFEKINNHWLYRSGKLAEGRVPALVKKGELRILPLVYYGDPILRKKAEPITTITQEIKTLAEQMIETMDAYENKGLAAPQVNHSIRLFVIRAPIDPQEGRHQPGEAQVFINPKLSLPSAETSKVAEACLSIPTLRSIVERPKEITVEYTTLDNTLITKRFSGWEARIIMHENDHIDGILYTDRLHEKEQKEILPLLQTLEKRLDRCLR